VTDLIERLRTIDETIVQRIYLREACSEAADELTRLRQRELDLLEERRTLRGEVAELRDEVQEAARRDRRGEVEVNSLSLCPDCRRVQSGVCKRHRGALIRNESTPALREWWRRLVEIARRHRVR